MRKINEKFERLIVRKLDGEILPAEEAELDRELLRNPHARAMLESYAAIDAVAGDVLAHCAGSRDESAPVLMMPAGRTATSRPRRNAWMLYVSAAAACIALMLTWWTPDGRPAASGTRSPERTVVRRPLPQRGETAGIVPAMEPVGEGGVWRVRGQLPDRLNVDRVTDRNVIVVPGKQGEFYLFNVDHVREFVRPDNEKVTKVTLDPI